MKYNFDTLSYQDDADEEINRIIQQDKSDSKIKFNFKIQQYQTDAVESITGVFDGESSDGSDRYVFDSGIDGDDSSNQDSEYAFSNHCISIGEDRLFENLKQIQKRNHLNISKSLDKSLGMCSLDIEMETGTGKTYVYIKTMFELNKRYGWSKFIVVVPSIAIREGVKKTFEITKDHFIAQYETVANFFIYDSSNLQLLNDFSCNSGIQVMIINYQAFAVSFEEEKNTKESRIIFDIRDDFQSRSPIDVIAANRPIVILDEPQKLKGDKTQKALRNKFNVLFSLNFSATHEVKHNLIYSLDALDAYNEKLVKKIEVKGIEVKNLAGTSCYIYLDDIILDSKLPPRARIEMEISHSKGVKRETCILSHGDSLYAESNGLEAYRDIFVTEIDYVSGYVEFSNGIRLSPGEVNGDVSEDNLRRIQIRETIASHFEKEEKLYKRGIKCLSLFFIDRVENYRQYDESGNQILGPYGRMFEEEYSRYLRENEQSFDSEYANYVKSIPVTSTHSGYFSIDKKTKHAIDSKVKKKEDCSDDVDAYDLILKDKERLLSFKEPVRFIFSHSALSEGWDNPNVFQICALKHSEKDEKRHQEVGRGLRLCVDCNGNRMDYEKCGELIHDINALTVVAGEGYDDFVRGLQEQISKSLRERPKKVCKELFEGVDVDIEGEEIETDTKTARAIYHALIRKGFLDDSDMPNEDYKKALESGEMILDPGTGLSDYNDVVTEILRGVIEGSFKGIIGNGKNVRINNRLNENFYKKEFQALWNEINHKYTYRVEFDSNELIIKSKQLIDAKLSVSVLSYRLVSGKQKNELEEDDWIEGITFESYIEKTLFLETSGSSVKYDLIGEIATGATITRKTAATILEKINPDKFDMFKQNPEEFITKVCDFIKQAKGTMIVDHILYNRLDDNYDSSIFTQSKSSCDPKNALLGKKHVMDYVCLDGLAVDSVERRFAESLERAEDVTVYAKLPKGFQIPTPIGNYTPDWAIAFDDSEGNKHLFFIAETKGSMKTTQLRPIEQAKIHCAEQLYSLDGSNVHYECVDSFESLLNKIYDLK